LVEAIFPAEHPAQPRRPLLGYAMVWAAATLFGINGAVAKVILASGLSSLRLAEARSTGALAGLAVVSLLFARRKLRVRGRELLFLALFGVAGLALVQLFYFLAIHRLPIGIALLIQFIAPLLVALWARYVVHEPVRRRIWAALALVLGGLALVVRIWDGLTLDGLGVAAALAGAAALAVYILLAERAVGRREPITLSFYGFLFASLFWAAVQPWWSFPGGVVARRVSLLGHLAGVHLPVWALLAWLIVLGTIVPFGLIVASLQHISATRAGIVATLEPVVATVVAYAWLGESLGTSQLVGAAVVLSGIGLAQTAR
jgi:drug/metabolite transporter (DMT)-like permease